MSDTPSEKGDTSRQTLYVLKVWGHDYANKECENEYGIDEAFELAGSYPSWMVNYIDEEKQLDFELVLHEIYMGDADRDGVDYLIQLNESIMDEDVMKAVCLHYRWGDEFTPRVPEDPNDDHMHVVKSNE